MNPLPTELRNKLERTIIEARDVAEAGAKAALEALAVHHHGPYGHMSPEKRKLRNHLRARARQLGDKQNRKSELEITHLVWECAYEHWHRMLFARFLAENDLLIEPEMDVAISLAECEELAKEEGKDLWTLASEFAQQMLPQIFRPNDPVLQVNLAREHRMKLEKLLNGLESSIFTASDSLGWVYQFWQSKRKKEVNESGNKIGADELPVVTQLFTEPYMVSFLLDNSLGAWWAARRLTEADLRHAENENELRKKASLTGMPLEYLRFVKLENGTWTPAAGTFDGWPEHLGELKALDPCCGSGHFLVAAFLMLVPMRMEMEGLSARDACDAVLRENLHGLEIDQRCVELAAFALALTSWRYPVAGGYRPLPELNLACTGLSVNVTKAEWKSIAGVLPDKSYVPIALDWLYDEFQNAPVLGSLIDPSRVKVASLVQWDALIPVLKETLKQQKDGEIYETGVVAQGLAKATQLLSGKYHWVLTNVPYLARGKQDERLKDFCGKYYPAAKNDLATVFLDRCLEFCVEGGTISIVLPQNWLFLTTYKKFREKLLKNDTWHLIARLGPQAFQTPMWDFNVQLITLSRGNVAGNRGGLFGESEPAGILRGMDVSEPRTAVEKAVWLLTAEINSVEQAKQLENHSHIIKIGDSSEGQVLANSADCFLGICTGDMPRFACFFWEHLIIGNDWRFFRSTPSEAKHWDGLEKVLFWEEGKGTLELFVQEKLGTENTGAWIRGKKCWGNTGIAVKQMGSLPVSLYNGELFDDNVAVIIPNTEKVAPAIYSFCASSDFNAEVRKVNQKLAVKAKYFLQAEFDLEHWAKVAEEKYPKGLPKPYSDDPTQWIFHGHPCGSVVWDEEKKWTARGPLRTDATVVQVAVARLLGFRWPAEIALTPDPSPKGRREKDVPLPLGEGNRRPGEGEMELADEQREWVKKCTVFLEYVDEDGIVCIPSVRGEEAAAGRLRRLLSVAFGSDWSPSTEQELIRTTGINIANLDDWLRDHFFEQHCKLFHHRPFIWHIWDGRRRDGFHALVNYHKLAEGNEKGRQLLENLTYSYLGDWITRQKEGVKRGEGGAEDRLVAALELQKRLIAIIEGEPPFDIFVRWKPVEAQPIGWEPDINDGVRLNIRPFMASDIPGGRKGTGILRWKPNIKWGKDRGKEPSRPQDQYPWFWENGEFTGDRVNDIHLRNEEKRQAREKAKRK